MKFVQSTRFTFK